VAVVAQEARLGLQQQGYDEQWAEVAEVAEALVLAHVGVVALGVFLPAAVCIGTAVPRRFFVLRRLAARLLPPCLGGGLGALLLFLALCLGRAFHRRVAGRAVLRPVGNVGAAVSAIAHLSITYPFSVTIHYITPRAA